MIKVSRINHNIFIRKNIDIVCDIQYDELK